MIIKTAAAAIAASLFIATSALASPVTYSFTAVSMSSSGTPNAGGIVEAASLQSALTGTFTFDPDAAFSQMINISEAEYDTGSLTFNEINASGFGFQTRVLNDFSDFIPGNPADSFQVRTPIDFGDTDTFRLVLSDSTESVFDSLDLPDQLNFADFDEAILIFQSFQDNVVASQLIFTLTDLTLVDAVVPLPAAAPLFLFAMGGLGLFTRRKHA